MESGEKELRKAFEEVTTKNVLTNVEYSKNTRNIVRDLEKKIDLLEGNIRTQNDRFELLQKQLTAIQVKLYQGGS